MSIMLCEPLVTIQETRIWWVNQLPYTISTALSKKFGNKVVSFYYFAQLAGDEMYQLNCKTWVNWVLGSHLITSNYRNYYVGFQPETSRYANSFKIMKQELNKVYEWDTYIINIFFGCYIFIYETSISIVKLFHRNSSWKETWSGTHLDS